MCLITGTGRVPSDLCQFFDVLTCSGIPGSFPDSPQGRHSALRRQMRRDGTVRHAVRHRRGAVLRGPRWRHAASVPYSTPSAAVGDARKRAQCTPSLTARTSPLSRVLPSPARRGGPLPALEVPLRRMRRRGSRGFVSCEAVLRRLHPFHVLRRPAPAPTCSRRLATSDESSACFTKRS
jgi:hypothetical protein